MIDFNDWNIIARSKLGNIEINQPGWFGLLAFFCRATERLLATPPKKSIIHFDQVKEKFGSLRIQYVIWGQAAKNLYDQTAEQDRYSNGYYDALEKLTFKLPASIKESIGSLSLLVGNASVSTCMGCGQPSGIFRSGGWVNNLCASCVKNREDSGGEWPEVLNGFIPDVTFASLRANDQECFDRLRATSFFELLKKSSDKTPSALPPKISNKMDMLLELSLDEALESDHGYGVRPIHYLRPHENLESILKEHGYKNIGVKDNQGNNLSDFLKKYDHKGFEMLLKMNVEKSLLITSMKKI